MENTAKNVALQLGALISLYVSISAFLVLVFGLINIIFPDAADYYYLAQSSEDGIRFSIATLVAFFPAYLILTRFVNQARRKDTGLYQTLTKWLLYISLLIGGLVVLGDLVAVIYTFLMGEITIRFILNALTVLVVVGAAFYYYLLDAKGYWNKNEKQSLTIGAVTLVIVVAAVIYGAFNIASPSAIREEKLDQTQVANLSDIEWYIEMYYQNNKALPKDISTAYDRQTPPAAPSGRAGYQYNITGAKTYELCATFLTETPEYERSTVPVAKDMESNNYDWDHGVGEKCYQRVIPASYDTLDNTKF